MREWAILPYRWRDKLHSSSHAKAIADILATPPITPRDDGLVLFSMISSTALLPYLVAVKSLWSELKRGRIAILDDGTLTSEDRAILAHHCADPEIMSISDVKLDGFPKGGCWERLLTILDRRGSEYWVQLDSDTVTLGPVPEVANAIATNASFTLLGGLDSGTRALPVTDFVAMRYPGGGAEGHIQARVESRLATLGKPEWNYVRGCAGFTGFAAGGPQRPLAAAFLEQMRNIVGEEDTHSWGTEQIASNFQIANEARAVMLPYDRFLNYWNEEWDKEARFVHFVGTHRYKNDAYKRASRIAIDHLMRPQ